MGCKDPLAETLVHRILDVKRGWFFCFGGPEIVELREGLHCVWMLQEAVALIAEKNLTLEHTTESVNERSPKRWATHHEINISHRNATETETETTQIPR